MKGPFVPVIYQEDQTKCKVCLAKTALNQALDEELAAIYAVIKALFSRQAENWETMALDLLLAFDDRFRSAQTEYTQALSVSLTLYQTVEKPERHKEAREPVLAYDEYREAVSQALAELALAFEALKTHFTNRPANDSLGSAFATLVERRETSAKRSAEFWTLTDEWTESRNALALDFLSDLTA